MISLSTIVIISLATLGIHLVTREGMIFGFVEGFWDKQINTPVVSDDSDISPVFENVRCKENLFLKCLSKPLTECPTCMGSLWGGLGYIVLTDGFSFLYLIITMLAVSAMNTIFYRLSE